MDMQIHNLELDAIIEQLADARAKKEDTRELERELQAVLAALEADDDDDDLV